MRQFAMRWEGQHLDDRIEIKAETPEEAVEKFIVHTLRRRRIMPPNVLCDIILINGIRYLWSVTGVKEFKE